MKSWPDQGGKPSCLAYIVVLIFVAVVIVLVLWLIGPAISINDFKNIGGPCRMDSWHNQGENPEEPKTGPVFRACLLVFILVAVVVIVVILLLGPAMGAQPTNFIRPSSL